MFFRRTPPAVDSPHSAPDWHRILIAVEAALAVLCGAVTVGLWTHFRNPHAHGMPLWLLLGLPGIASAILMTVMMGRSSPVPQGRGLFWVSLGWSVAYMTVLLAVIALLVRNSVSLVHEGPTLALARMWIRPKVVLALIAVNTLILYLVFSAPFTRATRPGGKA